LQSVNAQNPKLQEALKRLSSSEVYERQRAAIELGNLRDRGAVTALIDALKDDDDFVRNFAARSLGELEDSRAVDSLVLAMEDKNLLVQRSAAESLGFIGDSKAVVPLIEAARNGNDIMRRAAIEALGRIGDPGAVGLLVETLRDEDVYLQNGAAAALAAIGDPAIPQLVETLCDWFAGPRVLEILKGLKWQPSTDEERVWFHIASRDTKSILENWDTARNVLIESAESGDNRRIENSVFALIAIGQGDAVDELVQIIKRNGTQTIAKAYMDSGNNDLIEAARNWILQSGTKMDTESRQPAIPWGSMKSS
jgi:HEAT repeat protein